MTEDTEVVCVTTALIMDEVILEFLGIHEGVSTKEMVVLLIEVPRQSNALKAREDLNRGVIARVISKTLKNMIIDYFNTSCDK